MSIGMLVGSDLGASLSDRGQTTVSTSEFKVPDSNSKPELKFLYGHSFGIAIELAAENRGCGRQKEPTKEVDNESLYETYTAILGFWWVVAFLLPLVAGRLGSGKGQTCAQCSGEQ